jgi:hypothetical protein
VCEQQERFPPAEVLNEKDLPDGFADFFFTKNRKTREIAIKRMKTSMRFRKPGVGTGTMTPSSLASVMWRV